MATFISCDNSDEGVDDGSQQGGDPVDYSMFVASIDNSVTEQTVTRSINYANNATPNLKVAFDDDSQSAYSYNTDSGYYELDTDESMGTKATYVYSEESDYGALVAAEWPSTFDTNPDQTIKLRNMKPRLRISYKYLTSEGINSVSEIALNNIYTRGELSKISTALVYVKSADDSAIGRVVATKSTTLDSSYILTDEEVESELELEYTMGTYELYTVPQTLNGYSGYVTFVVDGEPLSYYFSKELNLQSGYLYDLIVEIKSVDNELSIELSGYQYEEWTDNGTGLDIDVDINNPAIDVWDGSSVSSTFTEGMGTTDFPYIISSAADLKFLSNSIVAEMAGTATTSYLASHYKLERSIDWSNNSWTPMGNNTYRFTGTFDGDGYMIKNVNVTQTTNYSGFFGYVGANDSSFNPTTTAYVSGVYNLTLKNITVSGAEASNPMGGFVGSISHNTKIENCHLYDSNITGGNKVGGIVGSIQGKVVGCSVWDSYITALDVAGTGQAKGSAGGVVGFVWGYYHADCSYNLVVDSNINGYEGHTAGIIGLPWTSVQVADNCYATGLTSDNETLYAIAGDYYGDDTTTGGESVSLNSYHAVESAADISFYLDQLQYTPQQIANLLNGCDKDTQISLDVPQWYWGVDGTTNTPFPIYFDGVQ